MEPAIACTEPDIQPVEPKLIGVSRNIRQWRKLIIQIVDTVQSVIVWGETGVGKELIIRSLYRKSGSTGKPFIKVNFAAMPDTLPKVKCSVMKRVFSPELLGYDTGNSNYRTAEFCS